MKTIKLQGSNYLLEKNHKDGFDLEKLTDKFTDYFKSYEYILGDWAYGVLRLKGFYKNSKEKTKVNDYHNIDKYIEEYCALDCSYFIIKKVE